MVRAADRMMMIIEVSPARWRTGVRWRRFHIVRPWTGGRTHRVKDAKIKQTV